MRLKVKEFNIYIDETIIIVGVLGVVFKEIRNYFENYFVCYLFIIFHELSHMFVASICGIKTSKITIRISGLSINLENNNCQNLKWLAIYLAGPVSNIILASIFKNVPMVCSINLALAIINLIPITPLDGYNIMRVLLNFFNVKNAKRIQKIIHLFILFVLGILGIYQLIILLNPSLILMVFYIIIQALIDGKKHSRGLYQEYYKNVTNFN